MKEMQDIHPYSVAAHGLREFDRRLLNRLQHGMPLVRHPWEALAAELGCTSIQLRRRVRMMLDEGLLTRFGPLFDVEQLGGAFTLAAMQVPESRFDRVTALLNQMPEVAHNYRRKHEYNMWFVLACDAPEGIDQVLAHITSQTGLQILNLPKEATYHVGLHFSV